MKDFKPQDLRVLNHMANAKVLCDDVYKKQTGGKISYFEPLDINPSEVHNPEKNINKLKGLELIKICSLQDKISDSTLATLKNALDSDDIKYKKSIKKKEIQKLVYANLDNDKIQKWLDENIPDYYILTQNGFDLLEKYSNYFDSFQLVSHFYLCDDGEVMYSTNYFFENYKLKPAEEITKSLESKLNHNSIPRSYENFKYFHQLYSSLFYMYNNYYEIPEKTAKYNVVCLAMNVIQQIELLLMQYGDFDDLKNSFEENMKMLSYNFKYSESENSLNNNLIEKYVESVYNDFCEEQDILELNDLYLLVEYIFSDEVTLNIEIDNVINKIISSRAINSTNQLNQFQDYEKKSDIKNLSESIANYLIYEPDNLVEAIKELKNTELDFNSIYLTLKDIKEEVSKLID